MPIPPYTRQLARIIVERAYSPMETLEHILDEEELASHKFERLAIEKGIVSSERMALVLAEHLRMQPINLASFRPNPDLVEKIGRQTMSEHLIVPLCLTANSLTVAMGDPFDLSGLDAISASSGLELVPMVAAEQDVRALLDRSSMDSAPSVDMMTVMQGDDIEVLEDERNDVHENIDEMLESAEGAPVVRMVNAILVEALRSGASDIHIEPMERMVRLRYRIDGELTERPGPPKHLQNAVVSRVKILSDLDIAIRRTPQDGRFNIRALGKAIDLRVSVLPTIHGEKLVMRILDKSNLAPSLDALGLDKVSEESMRYGVSQPHGILLVTGPTGSGKTTTLYSCLQDLNQPNVNVITCEDPVEYQLEGVNQVQIHDGIGLSFAASLRSILRQDPDIVLVGEIRDSITAEIAVKAALTGHLVLSTLHTNDAPGAITRLTDMGIEPFMLGSCLVLTQAQRLYRKLCPFCKKEAEIDKELMRINRIPVDMFEGKTTYEPVGCPRCTNGFKGRGAIMEVLLVNNAIREAILRRETTDELRTLAHQEGMVSLTEAGLQRAAEGLTSLEAALAITGGE